jgi:predicted secreted protein with PEFG-CTERM motif
LKYFFILSLLFIIPITAYAEDTTVTIVEGNIDPKCTITQCYNPTIVEITTGDTITWTNQDISAHIVISGDPFGKQTGIFDSGYILPEESFKHTFFTSGEYPYFCVLHPWATGLIKVTGTDYSPVEKPVVETQDPTIKRIGDIGGIVGGGKTFVMSYLSKGDISTTYVSLEKKSIQFFFVNPAPKDDTITFKIHKDMIESPNAIYINDKKLERFDSIVKDDYTELSFISPENTMIVEVYGSKVIPEFGGIAMMILTVSIISIVLVNRKTGVLK